MVNLVPTGLYLEKFLSLALPLTRTPISGIIYHIPARGFFVYPATLLTSSMVVTPFNILINPSCFIVVIPFLMAFFCRADVDGAVKIKSSI